MNTNLIRIVICDENSGRPKTTRRDVNVKTDKETVQLPNRLKVDYDRTNLYTNRDVGVSSDFIDSPTKEYFKRISEQKLIKKSLSPNRLLTSNLINTIGNDINVIKSDILQIDNLIKKYSDALVVYKQPNIIMNRSSNGFFSTNKLSSFSQPSTNFQIKCMKTEKLNKIDISDYFETIRNLSEDRAYLLNKYNCSTDNELIKTLAKEIFFNQLFINKIDNLSFLLNVKYETSQNLNNFNETNSKFSQLKLILNKLIEREDNEKFNKEKELEGYHYSKFRENNSYVPHKSNFQRGSSFADEDDFGKILEYNSISDFIQFPTKNPVINHIQNIFNQFTEKANSIFSQCVTDLSDQKKNDFYDKMKLRKSDDLIENFFIMRKMLLDIFNKREAQLNQCNDQNKNLIKEIEMLKNRIKEINTRDVNSILCHFESENDKLYKRILDYYTNQKIQLNEEMTTLSANCEEYATLNMVLKEENKTLQNQIKTLIKPKNSKRDLNDSYEELLRDQFTSMRNSFISKLNSLQNEIQNLKNSNKQLQSKLEDEAFMSKNIQNLFSNQISDMKRNIEHYCFDLTNLDEEKHKRNNKYSNQNRPKSRY